MKSPIRPPSFRARRGSVLFITLLLSTALAIAVGSYTMLTIQSSQLSHRSFQGTAALNLAESGLEYGLAALNHSEWDSWKEEGSDRSLTISDLSMGSGATGQIKVTVFGFNDDDPRIVAEGRIQPPTGRPIVKQTEITCTRRTILGAKVVSQRKVAVSGISTFNAFDSRSNLYSTNGLFDSNKKKDTGTIGSALVQTEDDAEAAVSLSQAKVYGWVATGGKEPKIGQKGEVRGANTPPNVLKDESRITTDFQANFPEVPAPDSITEKNRDAISGTATIGTGGKTSIIVEGDISNTGKQVITIDGDVTLYVMGNVKLSGEMKISANSSLQLYVVGNVDVGGGGIVNVSGIPADLLIFGLGQTPGAQTINLGGSASLHAGVYAPNAVITLNGGGSGAEFSGALIGYDIIFKGAYDVHLDEGLEDVDIGTSYAPEHWRELIGADQVTL